MVIAGAAWYVTVTSAVFDPALAVTLASWAVVRLVRASPFASDVTLDGLSVPAVVAKVTGTPTTPLPAPSRTVAITWTVPPNWPTKLGSARNTTFSAAAPPIGISSSPFAAAPERAVTFAVPNVRPPPAAR